MYPASFSRHVNRNACTHASTHVYRFVDNIWIWISITIVVRIDIRVFQEPPVAVYEYKVRFACVITFVASIIRRHLSIYLHTYWSTPPVEHMVHASTRKCVRASVCMHVSACVLEPPRM